MNNQNSGGQQNNATSASRSSSANSSARSSLSSSSQQQFLHHHNHHNHTTTTMMATGTHQGQASGNHLASSANLSATLPFNSSASQRDKSSEYMAKRRLLYYQKGKKFIQSIPIPLIVTCMITTFILCLIISECKSLNVMTSQASAMEAPTDAVGVNNNDDNAQGQFASIVGNEEEQQKQSARVASDLFSMQRAESRPEQSALTQELAASQTSSSSSDETSADNSNSNTNNKWQLDTERLMLLASNRHQPSANLASGRRHQNGKQGDMSLFKREFIANQLIRQMKRHSPISNTNTNNQVHSLGLDSLNSMLLGATNSASGADNSERAAPEPEAESAGELGVGEGEPSYLDGEPSAGAGGRPAYLRAGSLVPLDVDLGAHTSSAGDSSEPQVLSYKSHHNKLVAGANNNANHHNYNYNQHYAARHHSAGNEHHHQNPYKTIDQAPAHETSAAATKSHYESSGRLKNPDHKYDVAQIQCNNTAEGFERFACPTPDELGRHRCIEDRLFCDGYYDCPGGEDEERTSCMYYRLFVSHIDILTNTFLTWMKKQNRQQLLQQQHASRSFDVGLA